MIQAALKYLTVGLGRRSVCQVLWALMLLVHLPALLKGWSAIALDGGTSVRTASFVALNLSALLFVLKTAGVRWLDFATDRRSLVALTLAIGLLHVNLAPGAEALALPQAPHAAAGVILIVGLVPVQRLARRLLAGGRLAVRRARSSVVLTQLERRLLWLDAHLIRASRAPPVRISTS